MVEPELVCPRCRRVEAGELRVEALVPVDGGLGCACGAWYPVVDGIPVILRHPEGWLESEGIDLVRRRDLPARLLPSLGPAIRRSEQLVDTYANPLPSALRDWLAARVAALPRPVVELGSGVGHPGTLAIDLSYGLLWARGGGVVADAADPPLRAGCAQGVVVANLLDSCREPGLVLAQADALLAPGGTLIVTCAYAFADGILPPSARFGPADLRRALLGGPWYGHQLEARLVEERDDLAWRLRVGPRTEHVHQVHALVAQKPV